MPSIRWPSSARNALLVTVGVILLLQVGLSRMLTIDEASIRLPGLRKIPISLGTWTSAGEQSLDPTVLAQLRPDEYVLRDYQSAQGDGTMNLFVAFFKSLQHTYGPHAPRICLPGAGWLERSAKIVSIDVPGKAGGIPVNQLTYEKGSDRILVLYWYQNDRAIWAEEFQAKFRLLPDLVRYRRSDVSLVRLIAPLNDSTVEHQLGVTVTFAQALFPSLVERFGSSQ